MLDGSSIHVELRQGAYALDGLVVRGPFDLIPGRNLFVADQFFQR